MSDELPTVKAVVKYADDLRRSAERQMAADPYAAPYYCTTAAARTLVKRIANQIERETRDALAGQPDTDIQAAVDQARAFAPGRAIDHLRRRAAQTDHAAREDRETSERATGRHRRRQAQQRRDIAARRADLTLGARLDNTLAALATIATVSAAQIDGDRVQGGERAQQPPWAGDPHGYARDQAHHLIGRLEALLDDAQTRDMQKAA